jgi:VIT1/CCC1 family predicted Fe2+/Mn2+ transporter
MPLAQNAAAALARHRAAEHKIGRLQEYLKQIVYGGNDGITTTFSVVAGFAGFGSEAAGTVGGVAVLLFGLANLFADGTSMGLGEFLSSLSERDVYRSERARELGEIGRSADTETAEAAEMLAARGMSSADAAEMAAIMRRNPEFMADFMMQYEIGMSDPSDRPAARGLVTFVAFVAFGLAPLLPYFALAPVPSTFLVSVAATFAALVALGLLRWHVTAQTLPRCVGETVLVGGICAAVAYGVGWAFRVS